MKTGMELMMQDGKTIGEILETKDAEINRLMADNKALREALGHAHEWCPLCSGFGSYPVGKHTGNPHQEQCEACADVCAALAKARHD